MKHQVPDSLKFKKLQRRLGVSRVVVAGTLELLWIATQKNAPRGDIGRFDDETIAIECDWQGEPADLVEALVETGWLDRCPVYRLLIHDWQQHAPRYIHGVVAKLGGFATVGDYSPSLQSATIVPDCSQGQRNLTKRNLTKPNPLDASASCGEPALPDSPPAVPDGSDPVAMEFPTKGTGAQTWTLRQSKVAEYVESFPGIDVPLQLLKARQWCRDNPTKRKTPSGMLGFLTRWLGKAQNALAEGNRGSPPKTRGELATERFLARHSNGDSGMRSLGSEPDLRRLRAPSG